MPTLAEAFHARTQAIADTAARRLTAAWALTLERPDQEGEWLRLARPLLRGAAASGIASASGYVTVSAGAPTTPISRHLAPALVARIWDPLEVLGKGLADGMDWRDAALAATPAAEALGTTTVMAASRQTLAEQYPVRTRWRRMVNAGACRWCLGLAGAEWNTADQASFGHTSCKCWPVPAAELGDNNDRVLRAAGFDPETVTYGRIQQIDRLRQSERTARRRRQQAIDEAAAETDPDRIERLSQREQDWETRAERAAERRRILETGTHRLAA